LDPGDVLVVRGDNGSGKSTLLRLLAGLLLPSEGGVERPRGELRRTIGYTGLDLALYPNLTAREHLDFAAKMRGLPPSDGSDLARVGLAQASDRPVGQYSTGMRARVKLALATQAEPAVLLLDEPTASLDEYGRDLVAAVVEEQRARGVTIIATNDAADAALATHELVLHG
jgi:ABC-type multidrug transport system ATPase subunit